MISTPLLADFAIRLAFGLATALLLTSWRAVPLPFFRTVAQVILGLLVLAALDQAHAGRGSFPLWCVIAGAVLAYLSTVAWGLGLPVLGAWATVLIFMVSAGWLAVASAGTSHSLAAFNTCSRLASGFLLGSTLSAMLLGHHYLTAPTMSIQPLRRIVALAAGALFVRGALAALALCLWPAVSPSQGLALLAPDHALLLAARWGFGFVAAPIATYLTWKTAQMGSTQSATGILYITIIFVLFGELTSLILARPGAAIC